jgi:hypothetical protein
MVCVLGFLGYTLASRSLSMLALAGSAAAGALTGFFVLAIARVAEAGFVRLVLSGSHTPYVEQYSLQDAMVMQGRVTDAIASFEEIIAARPDAVTPRLRAAELYAKHVGDAHRAALLFREVQRLSTTTMSEDLYASNRLVDLLLGPLEQPGRALVELRRLIDFYPNTSAARQARLAINRLKESP